MPDGQGIKVGFGAISNASHVLTAQAKQIKNEQETLQQQLQQLFAAWGGEAQTAYHTLQNQWNQAADDLNQVLMSIATAVGAAHDSYLMGEKQNIARFQ